MTNDTLIALLALGYSDKEALPILKQLPAGLSPEESIQQALKAMAKNIVTHKRKAAT